MARGITAQSLLLFSFLLFLHIVCSSGMLVGFSYDATRDTHTSYSPSQAVSFLKRNNIPPSQFIVSLAYPEEAFIRSLVDTGISVHLCLNQLDAEELLKSRASVTSWLRRNVVRYLQHIDITIVLVASSKSELPSLFPTLKTLCSMLQNLDHKHGVKVSAMLSLSTLESSSNSEKKELRKIIEFINDAKSFVVIETQVDGELSLGDAFVRSTVQRAITGYSVFSDSEVPIVLNVKSSVVPSGIEIAEFAERVEKAIENHAEIKERFFGIFAEIFLCRVTEHKKLRWEEEMIFPSSRRELLNHEHKLMTVHKEAIHDSVTPVTNPVTTPPITVPSTNPTPGIVTVPSTNPVTVLPNNPTTPITVPSTNPAAPTTVPGMNPMPTPVTTPPVAPVTNPTNPVTVPPTLPVTSPVTNPVTTYPPPSAGVPTTPPISNPGTNPVSPGASGQGWCVAKTGATDAALQDALDYACGIGGADCSAIQVTGNCYNPNSVQAHASYAFNSYYQKNPVPTSCDFGGTATIVGANPSSGACVFPSSSSTSSVNPPSTFGGGTVGGGTVGGGVVGGGTIGGGAGGGGAGAGSGSVLNTNNTAGSGTVFGSDSPSRGISYSNLLAASRTLLLSVVATICIAG